MKTLLSILSIKTNSFSNEKIVIGLLAVSANHVYIGYSNSKIKLLDKFNEEQKLASFVESLLSQIKSTVIGANKELQNIQESLNTNKTIFSETYLSYLNDYNNGVLNFSKPLEVNHEFSESDFEKYYQNFVGESLKLKKEHPNFYSQETKAFSNQKGLEEKADLHYTFNPSNFKWILKDCSIPLITKNGKINSLQEIDFKNKPSTIANNLYETKIIHEALSGFAKTLDCGVEKIKVAFEEPALNSEQHKMFDLAIKEYKEQFEFLTLDKVDSFTDTILNSNYSKFSKLVAP